MERAREGVAILLKDVWQSAVVDFGCVSSRILGLNSSFQGLKFVWWWGMATMKEMVKKRADSGMTRIGLWIGVGNGYRLCILGYLNRWIGDRTRASITGAFGVPGENDNGRRVVVFCTERGLCVDNTYFKYRE